MKEAVCTALAVTILALPLVPAQAAEGPPVRAFSSSIMANPPSTTSSLTRVSEPSSII